MNNNRLSFSQLRCLNVVNSVDGKQYGRICDIIFDYKSACVLGVVVPYDKKSFCKNKDFFIPFSCIKTIGKDVIIVNIGENEQGIITPCGESCNNAGDSNTTCVQSKSDTSSTCHISSDTCDHRCDKCMLFDCDNRWK